MTFRAEQRNPDDRFPMQFVCLYDETALEQPCVGDLRLRHVRPLPH